MGSPLLPGRAPALQSEVFSMLTPGFTCCGWEVMSSQGLCLPRERKEVVVSELLPHSLPACLPAALP